MYAVNDIIFDITSQKALRIGAETTRAIMVYSQNERGEFNFWIPKSMIHYTTERLAGMTTVLINERIIAQNMEKL